MPELDSAKRGVFAAMEKETNEKKAGDKAVTLREIGYMLKLER